MSFFYFRHKVEFCSRPRQLNLTTYKFNKNLKKKILGFVILPLFLESFQYIIDSPLYKQRYPTDYTNTVLTLENNMFIGITLGRSSMALWSVIHFDLGFCWQFVFNQRWCSKVVIFVFELKSTIACKVYIQFINFIYI